MDNAGGNLTASIDPVGTRYAATFDQFSSDLAESIRVRFSKPALKDDILSLRVTELM